MGLGFVLVVGDDDDDDDDDDDTRMANPPLPTRFLPCNHIHCRLVGWYQVVVVVVDVVVVGVETTIPRVMHAGFSERLLDRCFRTLQSNYRTLDQWRFPLAPLSLLHSSSSSSSLV